MKQKFIKNLSENLAFLEIINAFSAIIAIGLLCGLVFWALAWGVSVLFVSALPHEAYQSAFIAVMGVVIAVVIHFWSSIKINQIIFNDSEQP